ncbi:MAG: DUF3786 domain-containing protein [Bacillota bacterium]
MSNDYNLNVTLNVAVREFADRQPLDMAARAGVDFIAQERCFNLPYLNRLLRIAYPGGEAASEEGNPLNIRLHILGLHYLSHATGADLTGQWISFKELPGGAIYNNPFHQRAVTPFLAKFGADKDRFQKAANLLGGQPGKQGHASMVLPVFPRVPISFVLWEGDDEFPATATILFDAVAPQYLPTEDYALLASLMVGEMHSAVSSIL